MVVSVEARTVHASMMTTNDALVLLPETAQRFLSAYIRNEVSTHEIRDSGESAWLTVCCAPSNNRPNPGTISPVPSKHLHLPLDTPRRIVAHNPSL